MTPWVTWLVFVVVAIILGVTATSFSVHTVRWVSSLTTVILLVVVTAYGLNSARSLGMPPPGPPDLQAAFAKGADSIAGALLRPLWPGHTVPEPGRVGWAIIVALLLLGYRRLEAQAYARQAPVLDTSQLTDSQPSIPAAPPTKAEGTGADGPGLQAAADDGAALTDAQRHDQLAAELKFRLAAMEIRSPSILPGGSRSNGLASLAEDTDITAGYLAGAIIRLFGLLWPGPRRWMLRVWVESKRLSDQGDTRVTVELDDPRTGDTVATKTITAASIDDAASMVAGYVTRQVFAWDPTAPPWCYGAADGHDLGAMLIARQERVYADSWETVRTSRLRQIRALQAVTSGNRCAGLVRYELASLHDLGTRHLTALRLHAMNREQYPRFFRGRYRLCMSLEMAANRGLTFSNKEGARYAVDEVLAVLSRSGLHMLAVPNLIVESEDSRGRYRLSDELSVELLRVALGELRIIRRQLTLHAVLWAALRRRDERTVWRPHRKLRVRQGFRDGVCVAELLIAVRTLLNSCGQRPRMSLADHSQALRIVGAITGDVAPIEALFRMPPGDAAARRAAVAAPASVRRADGGRRPTRERVRLLPWLRQTASWQAAYNAACVFSALTQEGLATDDLVVRCLQRAVDSRDSEMERAYDWIAYDPDFLPLKNSPPGQFTTFKKFLRDQSRHDYPRRQRPAADRGEEGDEGT
ncbi:MAG TPA: hypothetical protein VMU95_33840 [Trebonia sp.]|nr:hypothetical protein [Trebonia sp.]